MEADEDWAEGPKGLVAASLHMLVDRERDTHLLVLTSEAVMLLTPTTLDARAHGAGDSERLPSVLKKALTPQDLEQHLRMLVQKAPDQVAAQLAARGLSNVNVHAPDARVLFCVLMDQVVRDVLDTPVDAAEKDRLLKHMRAKLHELLPTQHGVHEAMDRLADRVRTCKKILEHPCLSSSGSSVLAQAMQLTVNRKDWLGENALRPWDVARSLLCKYIYAYVYIYIYIHI